MTASLSVVVPNYNHGAYLPGCLDAILKQGRPADEVIVLDDGSTDDSRTVLQRISQNARSVRSVCNERNFGVVFCLNRGLHLARGDFVYFAAADDYVLPGFFEKAMAVVEQYPQTCLCFSDPASFDDQTGVVSENPLRLTDSPCYFSPADIAELIRCKGAWIAGHTSIIRRSALDEAGGFIPELRWHCDWFALLVVAFRHGACYIPEPLAAIRVSPASYSASGRRNWPAQRRVLNHILHLLKSQSYQDVLPYFQRSRAMSHFDSEIVRAMLGSPNHWDIASFRLIRHLLWQVLKRRTRKCVSRMTPSPVKTAYRSVRDSRRKARAGASLH